MRKLDRGAQRLGEKLRALRRGQAVSLDMMEKITCVQRVYLEALESGRYEELPAPLYTRNFIRAYARALNADEHYFLELYNEECGACDLVDPMRLPRQKVRMMRFFLLNKVVKYSLLAVVVFAVFGYLGWQINSIIQPPEIVLFSPADEVMTSSAIVTVEGIVEDDSTVYVNGSQVILNTNNTFSTQIDLEKGLNIINVEAERRYSKRAKVERSILFYPEELVAR